MELEERIKKYCEQAIEEKALHKSNDVLKNDIKETLLKDGRDEAESGKYTVRIETRVTEKVDEVKMLDVLKRFWKATHGDEKCPFIATVECVDMEALETFMYSNELPQEVLLELDGCRVKSETKALTYKVAKN